MNTKSTLVVQSKQTSADSQDKAPVFHVQTGTRAGGFYDRFYSWWDQANTEANAADASTGVGRWGR